MLDREDLESFGTQQLHDQAIGFAKANGDLDWLWRLMGSLPGAEGQLGELDDSGIDIASTVSAINGYRRADRDAAEGLRPIYIEYLLEQQEP